MRRRLPVVHDLRLRTHRADDAVHVEEAHLDGGGWVERPLVLAREPGGVGVTVWAAGVCGRAVGHRDGLTYLRPASAFWISTAAARTSWPLKGPLQKKSG